MRNWDTFNDMGTSILLQKSPTIQAAAQSQQALGFMSKFAVSSSLQLDAVIKKTINASVMEQVNLIQMIPVVQKYIAIQRTFPNQLLALSNSLTSSIGILEMYKVQKQNKLILERYLKKEFWEEPEKTNYDKISRYEQEISLTPEELADALLSCYTEEEQQSISNWLITYDGELKCYVTKLFREMYKLFFIQHGKELSGILIGVGGLWCNVYQSLIFFIFITSCTFFVFFNAVLQQNKMNK